MHVQSYSVLEREKTYGFPLIYDNSEYLGILQYIAILESLKSYNVCYSERELSMRLSVSGLLHDDQVVQNWQGALSLAWHK